MVVAAWPMCAPAATYPVTNNASCDPTIVGTPQWAVAQANANAPGPHTITFPPGFTYDSQQCELLHHFADPSDYFLLNPTVSVNLVGDASAPAKFYSLQAWLNQDGTVVNPKECPVPAEDTGGWLLGSAPGFAEVGADAPNNSGLVVTVDNVNFDNLSTLARVREAATLTIAYSTITNIRDPRSDVPLYACSNPVLFGEAATLINLMAVTVRNAWTLKPQPIDPSSPWFGAIQSRGQVNIEDSVFQGNYTYGAVVVLPGGGLNVVTSKFLDGDDGILFEGTTAKIVNSVFSAPLAAENSQWQGVHLIGNGSLTLEGSTISTAAPTQPANYTPAKLLSASGSSTLTLKGTAIGFSQSAVAATFPAVALSGTPSVFVSNSWVQPSHVQDAAALTALFPGVLTDPPGLTTDFALWPSNIAPLPGVPAAPGLLIDAIPDAQPGAPNSLLNPISGLPILEDAFGHSRWDVGNDTRNIGAMQTALSPYLVLAAVGDAHADLAWNQPPPPPSGAITGYLLQYRVVGQPIWMGIFVLGADTVTTAVTDLTNGLAYEFRIAGVNSLGTGTFGNLVAATPAGLPGAPVVTPTSSQGQVDLSWTVPPDGGSSIISYLVVYRWIDRPTWQSAAYTGTNSSITGLWTGTWEFKVAAVNAVGAGPFSDVVTVVQPGIPAAPVVSATAGPRQVALSWTVPADRGSPITGYVVKYRGAGPCFCRFDICFCDYTSIPVTGTSHTIDGLANGITYEFTVAAISAIGTGESSNKVTATPADLPGAPVVTVTAGVGEVALSWTVPPNNGSPLTGYVIQYRTLGGPIWLNWPHTGTGTTDTVVGLAPGVAFEFEVAAVSAVGLGPFSKPASPAASIIVAGGSGQYAVVSVPFEIHSFVLPLEVTVLDASRNPVLGALVTFVAPGAGASATLSAAARTDANGGTSVVASPNGIVGPYAIAATVEGVSTPAVFTLTNTTRPTFSERIVTSGGDGQSAMVNTAFQQPLQVTVVDASNNPVPGLRVTFVGPVTGAAAVFSPSEAITDARGIAMVTAASNGVVGMYNVTAWLDIFSGRTNFTLTNVPAPADVTAVPTLGDGALALLMLMLGLAGIRWLPRKRAL